MLANLFWALLGIVAGACIAIQAPINAELARGLGLPVAAAAASFLSGAVILGLVTAAITQLGSMAIDWQAPPLWTFVAGGCLGAVYVTSAVVLTPRIGVAAVIAFAVAGQILAGLVLDKIGFMGIAARELSLGRFAGAALLVIGVVMVRFL